MSGCRKEDVVVPVETRVARVEPKPSAPVATNVPVRDEAAVEVEARETLMRDHFDVASQARDAVVRGRLMLSEAPLTWLGQHGFSKQAPAEWIPYLDRMQTAARRATSQPSLDGVAHAVGEIAATCGNCHVALGKGPRFEPSDWTELDDPGSKRRSAAAVLQERMHAQTWGMERMWEGLVGPWDVAWRQGAQSLQELDAHRKLPARLAPQLARVRALGQAALEAKDHEARAVVYGDLLATCGGCHAALGVDPSTVEPEDATSAHPREAPTPKQ